jgi:hypothetical protein
VAVTRSDAEEGRDFIRSLASRWMKRKSGFEAFPTRRPDERPLSSISRAAADTEYFGNSLEMHAEGNAGV